MKKLNKSDIKFLKDIISYDVEIYNIYIKLAKLEYLNTKNSDEYQKTIDQLKNKLSIEESLYKLNCDTTKKEEMICYLLNSVPNYSNKKETASALDRTINKIRLLREKETISDKLTDAFLLDNARNELIFIEDMINNPKYQDFKEDLIRDCKYDIVYTRCLLEQEMISSNFNVDENIYDYEDLLAQIYKINENDYLTLKRIQVLKGVNDTLNIITSIPNQALVNREVLSLVLKNCCFFKALLLKLDNNLFNELYDKTIKELNSKNEAILLIKEAFEDSKSARKNRIQVLIKK